MDQLIKRSEEDGSNWLDHCQTKNNIITPLSLVCMRGHYAIIELLVGTMGVDVKATDKDGDTAIHLIAILLRKIKSTGKLDDAVSELVDEVPFVPSEDTAPKIYEVRQRHFSKVSHPPPPFLFIKKPAANRHSLFSLFRYMRDSKTTIL